jgi:hypothetical protein
MQRNPIVWFAAKKSLSLAKKGQAALFCTRSIIIHGMSKAQKIQEAMENNSD